jgi:hypothetical protein
MVSFIQRDHSFFSPETTHASLVATLLSGHDQASKKSAQHAVDILKKCKSTVHEFTDEIIDYWSLPRSVIERYHFDGVTELNEWLGAQM